MNVRNDFLELQIFLPQISTSTFTKMEMKPWLLYSNLYITNYLKTKKCIVESHTLFLWYVRDSQYENQNPKTKKLFFTSFLLLLHTKWQLKNWCEFFLFTTLLLSLIIRHKNYPKKIEKISKFAKTNQN